MVNARNALLFILLAAAGVFVFFYIFESDEAKIRRNLEQLRVEIQKDSAEAELVAAAKARTIGRMFTDPCSLSIPSHSISGTYSRRELAGNILMARSQYRTIALQFHDIGIDFPGKDRASATFTVMARAVPAGDDEEMEFEEIQEVTCRFVRIEDEWLLGEAETVDVLKK